MEKHTHDGSAQHYGRKNKNYEKIVLPALVGLAIAGISFWGGWSVSKLSDTDDEQGVARFGSMMQGDSAALPERDDTSTMRGGFGMRGAQTVVTKISSSSITVKNIQDGETTTYTINDDTSITAASSDEDVDASDIAIGDSVRVSSSDDATADSILISTEK